MNTMFIESGEAPKNSANVDLFIRESLRLVLNSGFQIQPDAIVKISNLSESMSPDLFASRLVEWLRSSQNDKVFIDVQTIDQFVSENLQLPNPEPSDNILENGKSAFRAYAKEVESDFKVIREPSTELSSQGTTEHFLRCFRDRFVQLRKILRQRLDSRDAVSIGEALAAKPGTRVKTIGMIFEKDDRGNIIRFRIDDFDNVSTILVRAAQPQLMEKAQNAINDQVVCVLGTKASGDAIYADDILWPEVPNHKPNLSNEPLYAVFTSDFHFGSRIFEKDLVERLIVWINGKAGGAREREVAGRVKYFIIGGDLVDGIGVYPQQEHELEISDIYKQYEFAAGLIAQIPDYVEVIIIPGNHDATRKALPQPKIPEKYADPVYKARKVHSLGNPSQISIHGVNVLLHHGRSLEDLVVLLPNMTHDNPTRAMAHILRSRHLAPVYGGKTPMAPETRDLMVIDSVPDIYHTGHIHVYDQDVYRGTLLLNSGSWQGQTSYQKKMGLIPTYGVVPVVNLQTMAVTRLDFSSISP